MTRHAHPSERGEHSGVRLLSTRVAVPDTPHSQFQLAVSISSSTSTSSGKVRVRAAGELDLATAPQLASDLAALNGSIGTIELDLGGVTFIDLAGLRAILEARCNAQARDQQLHITVPGRACARLLELTRTTELLGAD